jgi:hypothetical protein
MPTRPLTEKQLREAFDFFVEAKGNISEASRLSGLYRSTYKNRILAARDRHPAWFEGIEDKLDEQAERHAPVQRTLSDEVKVHRAQEELKSTKRRFKDAVARIADLEEKVSEYEWLGNVDTKPADWVQRPAKSEKSEHTPMLFTSDFQLGEVVDARETEHGHDYNKDLFKARYRAMIEKTIYLSFEHGGKDWTYPGIIYARGGDTISGGIHEELAETDDLSPIEAVEMAFEEEAAGIAKLADAFGKVFVPDCGGGNHDRTTRKPRSKGAHANFDRLVNFMLRREFQHDARVTFQTTRSMDVVFNIYNKNVLLTHGDRIGSRGGQGFIGPAATIMRGAQKVIMEQAAINRQIDLVMMGHFHTPMWLGWVMVNGALPGYSEFAKMNRMRPFPPQQYLSYWHEGRGMVDLKPIDLTDAK